MTSPAAALARGLIRAYKLGVAPLLPPACRFEPTCSDYASQAIGRFGLIRGGWLAVRRLARCHPWGRFGYDPIPESADRHTCSSPSWSSPGVEGGAAIRARSAAAPKVRH